MGQISRNIGLLILWIILLCVDYLFIYGIDKKLYTKYRLVHNDDKPTIEIKKFRCFFKRYDKSNKNVYFKKTIILQLITIVLIICNLFLNILLFFVNESTQASIVIAISYASGVIYTSFLSVIERKIKL